MKKLLLALAIGFILPACSHQSKNVAEFEVESDSSFDWAAFGVTDSATPETAVVSKKSRPAK